MISAYKFYTKWNSQKDDIEFYVVILIIPVISLQPSKF